MVRKVLLALLALVVVAVIGVVGFVSLAPDRATSLAVNAERRASGLAEQTVVVDGLRWKLLVGGPSNAGPPLVLIHGFGGDKDNWTRAVRPLTLTQRVIIPDLIGFGESDKPGLEAGYTVPQQAARLHALIRQLDLGPIFLGGNSMGGWIASAYLAAHPQDVIGLWLLAPAGVAGAQKSEMVQYTEAGGSLPLLARNREEFDKRMSWLFVKTPPLPGFVRQTLSARAAANADQHEQIRQQLYGVSPSQEALLAAPRQLPALIVWGESDRVLHVSGAEVLAPYFNSNGTQVIRMPGIGHLPMTESPEQAAADYLAWRQVLRRWNIAK